MGVTLLTLTGHANYICVGQKLISPGPIFNVDVCPADVRRKISVSSPQQNYDENIMFMLLILIALKGTCSYRQK